MPAKKSKTGGGGKAKGGAKGKGQGGGSKAKTTQPVKASNHPRTQTTSPPKPPAHRIGPTTRSLYGERPLLRPIAFVPGVHTRILFSCEHEEEAKEVELQVKEEVIHVENVDDLSGGLEPEVYGGDETRESVETHALTFGSIVLAFEGIHIGSETSESTPIEPASPRILANEEQIEDAQPSAAAIHAPDLVPMNATVHTNGTQIEMAPPRAEPAATATNSRAAYMTTVLQTLRKSAGDNSGKHNVTIPPPIDKETRKYAHELARVFHMTGLKSQNVFRTSKKTTANLKQKDENKVATIMKKFGPPGAQQNDLTPKNPSGVVAKAASNPGPYKKDNGMPQKPGHKHKEGDAIGKAAPKINASNVGFKMLENMGWSDGEKIGSGGLEAPIDAVMKRSRLGLGA